MARMMSAIHAISMLSLISVGAGAKMSPFLNSIKQQMADYAQNHLGDLSSSSVPCPCTPEEFVQLVNNNKKLEYEKAQLAKENNSLKCSNAVLSKEAEYQKKVGALESANAAQCMENNRVFEEQIADLQQKLQEKQEVMKQFEKQQEMEISIKKQLAVERGNLKLHYELLKSNKLSIQDKQTVQRQIVYLKQNIAEFLKSTEKSLSAEMLIELGFDPKDRNDIINMIDQDSATGLQPLIIGTGAATLAVIAFLAGRATK
ncbi:hypothetical protein KJZ61_01225 [Candidatus Dependentiae bacterium]|nr:hypothetical protein [Candidatus Dependentiae bacterium]